MLYDEITRGLTNLGTSGTVTGQDLLLSGAQDEVFALDKSYLEKRIVLMQKKANIARQCNQNHDSPASERQ